MVLKIIAPAQVSLAQVQRIRRAPLVGKTIKNTNNYLDSIIDDNQSIVNLSEPIINVFPNPNNGSFFLSLQNIVSYVDIICTDRFGKVMYEKKNLKLDNQKINLKQVTTGIYYLHVITKHKIFNKKIII